MIENKKVLVAVCQGNIEPWLTIKVRGQDTTWVNVENRFVDVVNFKSKNAPLLAKNYDRIHEIVRYRKNIGLWQGRLDKLIAKLISKGVPQYHYSKVDKFLNVESWSTYQLQGRRFIALYDWFLKETQYDFLFTTTTSSYIVKQNLLNLVNEFDTNSLVYAGYLLPENQSEQFVSGAGTLLSRKTIEMLAKNWHLFDFSTLEDVAHSKLLSSFGVKAIALPRTDLFSVNDVRLISQAELDRAFHFRCKSASVPRQDAEIMQALHQRIITK
jgi:hypothetical protein